ncbi:MAG: exodeoxyribonuclease III [Bacteroidales bacterium]|nr:exodeoxyribonuclease III [Bacteroidales bacterium]
MKLISWNVNGIRAAVGKDFYNEIKKLDPDILCIQETKAQDDVVNIIGKELKGYEVYVNSAEKKGYSGTAIFSKIKANSSRNDIGITEHDQEGRIITIEYEEFYLVNVYVPNAGQGLKRLDYRKEWDNALLDYLKDLDQKKPVIFTGDFNVAHEPIDLARPKQNYNKTAGYTQTEIDGFKGFLNMGLTDTFRYFHRDKVQYTFWNMRFNARATNVGWRIDYFLVSNRFLNHVKQAYILDGIMGSDHCPIGLELEL